MYRHSQRVLFYLRSPEISDRPYLYELGSGEALFRWDSYVPSYKTDIEFAIFLIFVLTEIFKNCIVRAEFFALAMMIEIATGILLFVKTFHMHDDVM